MRVLLITTEFYPNIRGGIGTSCMDLVQYLSCYYKDIEMHIVYPVLRSHLAYLKDRLDHRDNIVLHPVVVPITRGQGHLFNLYLVQLMHRLFSKERYDILHNYAALTLPKNIIRKTPSVINIHGVKYLGDIRKLYCKSLQDTLLRIGILTANRAINLLLSSLHGAIARVCDYSRTIYPLRSSLADFLRCASSDTIKRKLLAKAVVIPYGLDVERIQLEYSEDLRRYNENMFVYLGRLVEYKGIIYLLKAFALVAREMPQAKLLIIGSGPLERLVIEFVEKYSLKRHVFLVGALPRRHALRLLARSSILVHPSLAEAFGLVLLEAFSLGKPVIAQRTPYSKELVEELGTGLITDFRIPNKASETMLFLLEDASLRKRLAQNALYRARTMFDIKVVVSAYANLYKSLM